MKEAITSALQAIANGDTASAIEQLSEETFAKAAPDLSTHIASAVALLEAQRTEAASGELEKALLFLVKTPSKVPPQVTLEGDLSEVTLEGAADGSDHSHTGHAEEAVEEEAEEEEVEETTLVVEAEEEVPCPCSGDDCGYEHVEAIEEAASGLELITESGGGAIEEAIGDGGNVYRVTLITAGVSKNRNYWSPKLLESTFRLFEGAKAFADHPSQSEMRDRPERSVRDIIGWYEAPRWVPTVYGGKITANLHLLPGQLAENVKAAHALGKPDLFQLSVNVSGKSRPRMVEGQMVRAIEELARVHSVDAVTEASAGGSIDQIAASERPTEEVKHLMSLDNLSVDELKEILASRNDLREAASEFIGTDTEEEVIETPAAPAVDTSVTEALTSIQSELEAVRQERAMARCEATLERSLTSSALPQSMSDHVRSKFEGRIFEAAELDSEINAAKELVSLAQAQAGIPATVPWGQVNATESQVDKWVLAMDGLISGEVQKDAEGRIVKPFLNLRHAYATVSGKSSFDQTGYEVLGEARGYDSGMFNEAVGNFTEAPTAMVTTNFGKILGDSITRRALLEYRFPALQEWKKFSRTVPVSDLRKQLREIVGEFQLTENISEGAAYTDLSSSPLPEQESFYQAKKRGGQAALTLEAVINDDLGKLRSIPVKLGRAAGGRIYKNVFDLLMTNPREDTFITSGSTSRGAFASRNQRSPGNLVGDDGTAGFLGNVDSALIKLNDANLSNAKKIFRIQQAATTAIGGRTSLSYILAEPRNLIVSPENEAIAKKLLLGDTFYAKDMANSANDAEPSVNIHRGTLGLIVVPYWQEAAQMTTNLAGSLSPKNLWLLTSGPDEIPIVEVGFLNGREDPELFVANNETVGDMFALDVITWKVRHFWDAGIMDTRGFVGAHVKRTG